MALDWLPILPDLPTRRRSLVPLAPTVGWAPFSTDAYPVSDVLASLTFLPSYPDRVPHAHGRAPFLPPTASIFTAAIAPVSWLPSYPDHVPHRRLPVAAQLALVAPSSSLGVLIGQQQAWRASFPDQVSRHRVPRLAGAFWTVPPGTAATAVGCGVQLTRGALAHSALITQAVVQPTQVDAQVTATDLITEGIC